MDNVACFIMYSGTLSCSADDRLLFGSILRISTAPTHLPTIILARLQIAVICCVVNVPLVLATFFALEIHLLDLGVA